MEGHVWFRRTLGRKQPHGVAGHVSAGALPTERRCKRKKKRKRASASHDAMHTALDATSARQHVRCVPSSSVPPLPHRSLEPVVTPGEPIDAEPGCLRGHGTLMRDDGTLVATVSGVVERVNKLVSVRPLRARYHGEVGDVVIGRIVEARRRRMGREGTQDRAEGAHALAQVGAKRWRADINGRQDAVLMLASINLPGGEQRRRTAEDQLNMRWAEPAAATLAARSRPRPALTPPPPRDTAPPAAAR